MKECTGFYWEICDKRFKRLEFLSKIHSFDWNSKQDSIVRYVTKDSIWHWDLKTRLEYSSKIHSFEWNRKQDSIVKFVTKDSIWHLEWNGQNLSKICYKRLNFK